MSSHNREPYREPEPIERPWILPHTEGQMTRSGQPGENTFRYPPEVKLYDGSVYQCWSPLAAGKKGGLWVGTWSRHPTIIWRLFSWAETNIPPHSSFTALQKHIRESLDA